MRWGELIWEFIFNTALKQRRVLNVVNAGGWWWGERRENIFLIFVVLRIFLNKNEMVPISGNLNPQKIVSNVTAYTSGFLFTNHPLFFIRKTVFSVVERKDWSAKPHKWRETFKIVSKYFPDQALINIVIGM